ncbi:MAG TPA: response regulator [Polyangiaceae bacterium]|jgi:DNA-binding response OmpR family regulator|nr:response regulator [Polyangiaceae bacterium]
MGKRLLLVEDEPTLARALVRLLRRASFDVTLATSCAEAQKPLGTFSVGVFDIDLPDGDGVELAEGLRRSGVVRRLVFFSGTPVGKKRVRALGLGPFVEKSKGYGELRAAIERVLDCKQAKVAGDEHSESGEPTDPPPSGVRGSRPRGNE